MSHAHGESSAWDRALGGVRDLSVALGGLRSDYPTTMELLKEALAGVSDRRIALLLLLHLGQDYVLGVADRLVRISLSHRDAMLIRQILGSLPHDEIARVVPRYVWEVMDEENDSDAYRRLAELLQYLGLSESLQELSERAMLSDDAEIREVGMDFGHAVD